MEYCAEFIFLRSLVLVALYLCSSFRIFNRPILEKYVSQVERAPHLLQSCLCATWNGFPLATSEMHLSFKSLTIISTPNLQASLMDFHHDTSLRSILEDDSISSTFRTHIFFCSGKRIRLWLAMKPSIYSFHIAHSTFTLTLRFCFGLIQPSASNFLTCECGHRLNASGTHLTRCPFGCQ